MVVPVCIDGRWTKMHSDSRVFERNFALSPELKEYTITEYEKINAGNGNVTVKKGLKKGTYKVKAQVKASGDDNYKASDWKETTFKVLVK